MNVYMVIVGTSLLVGMGCAFAAYQLKRDPLRWFIAGVMLNILAVLLIGFLERGRKSHAEITHA